MKTVYEAESLFHPSKMEEVNLKEDKSKASAEVYLQVFIEQVYNTRWLHSSWGYLPHGSSLRQALLRREE